MTERLFQSIFSVIARLLVNADCRCHSFGLVGWGSLPLNPTLLTLKEEKLGTGSDAATNAMQESQCVLTATGTLSRRFVAYFRALLLDSKVYARRVLLPEEPK